MSKVFNLDDYRERRGRKEDERYYQFLCAINEHGNYDRACNDSGLDRYQVERRRRLYPDWDVAVTECFNHFLEEVLVAAVERRARGD